MAKKILNIPNSGAPLLRFPEFTKEWSIKKLGDVASISSGGTPNRTNPAYWNGTIPWITTSLVDFNLITDTAEKITDEGLENSSAKLFSKGSILMAMYGQGKTRGKVAILGIEAATNQACACITTDEAVLSHLFLFQNLSKRYDEIRELSNQGGQENLSGTIIKTISLKFPSLSEQYKIVSFLSLIDHRISTQSKIIEGLKSQKRIFINKLFSQEPFMRFPTFKEDWNLYRYKDLLEVSTKKNTDNAIDTVLSASQTYGMVERSEIDIDIKFDRKSTSSYKIVEPGDYVIHLRSFQGGFAFSDKTGICSPAYTILKPKSLLHYAFLKDYFMSEKFIKSLKLVTYGIRDGRSINVDEFLKLTIMLPPKKEQTKIAQFVSMLDGKIELESNVMKLQIQQKQFLLQNMLI